ncbi:MAG: hypothetical protein KF855_12460 [Acidobacteria bacterium]|nr:hypothetical protein [Acidobacteriota bacterium]
MTETETLEIIRTIRSLPSDKIEELKDFAFFLREKYGIETLIDESDEWTDEDLHDITKASLRYAYRSEDDQAKMFLSMP